jgi:DNA polymerase/3'-5' exonuclease PolX
MDFIEKHIKPWIETGSCPELKQARDCEDYSARKELLSVHGVGGEMLKRLLAAGARSVKDLAEAIKAAEAQGEVDSNGFVNFNGVNLIKEVIVGVKHHEDMKVKVGPDTMQFIHVCLGFGAVVAYGAMQFIHVTGGFGFLLA